MALLINTNISSMTAQRNMSNSTGALGKTYQRLSSGLRINGAADDEAGLSVSTRMVSQIRAFDQSVRNANDAISLVQVAEGALAETTSAMQRIRELAVQAANDTNVSGDRSDMQKEVNQLLSEINRIAQNTAFNGQSLLQGSFSAGKLFHIGASNGQTIRVSIQNMSLGALSLQVGINGATVQMASLGTGTTHSANQNAAESMIFRIDRAIGLVSTNRATLGAIQNRFEAAIANLTSVSLDNSQAKSRIMDVDMAAETAKLTQNSILQQAGTAILAQANQQPAVIMQLLK